MMEEALTAAALAYDPFTAAVAGRINWDERPQGDPLPGIVFTLVSDPPLYTFKKRLSSSYPLVQLDCWGGTPDEAKALREIAKGFIDTLTTAPLQAFIEGVHGSAEAGDGPQPETQTTTFFRASLDVRVWCSPAA